MALPSIELIAATDRDFAWIVGTGAARRNLAMPPGGLGDPAIYTMLQGLSARLAAHLHPNSWLIVSRSEIVGLCSIVKPPDADGGIEIGYGIAAGCRRQGFATAAIGALVDLFERTGAAPYLTAGTAIDNLASQRVLVANRFRQTGQRTDPEDGALLLWRRDLRR